MLVLLASRGRDAIYWLKEGDYEAFFVIQRGVLVLEAVGSGAEALQRRFGLQVFPLEGGVQEVIKEALEGMGVMNWFKILFMPFLAREGIEEGGRKLAWPVAVLLSLSLALYGWELYLLKGRESRLMEKWKGLQEVNAEVRKVYKEAEEISSLWQEFHRSEVFSLDPLNALVVFGGVVEKLGGRLLWFDSSEGRVRAQVLVPDASRLLKALLQTGAFSSVVPEGAVVKDRKTGLERVLIEVEGARSKS